MLPADAIGPKMARLRREHHRMLGNGWCTRPPELDCAFESICEICTFFQTTIEFRPTLVAQRDDAAARHQDHREQPFTSLLAASTRMPHEPPPAPPAHPPRPAARPRHRRRQQQILSEAIDDLARLRTPYWLGDSAVHLHALASLIAQAQQLLPQAARDARDQELTWAQIGELPDTTAATAARRYRNQP